MTQLLQSRPTVAGFSAARRPQPTAKSVGSQITSDLDQGESPAAFRGLVAFYQLAGLSFFGFNDFIAIKLITFVVSIAFAVVFAAVHVPCLLTCNYEVDIRTLFDKGVKAEFIEVVVMMLKVYHGNRITYPDLANFSRFA